jgi:hypothetical protein
LDATLVRPRVHVIHGPLYASSVQKLTMCHAPSRCRHGARRDRRKPGRTALPVPESAS